MTERREKDLQAGTVSLDTQSGAVQLSAVGQIRSGRVILDIPALTLQPGRRYALLGANGSGKSTLLQLLADHLASPSGETGYLPQKPYAFSLSVTRNIALGIPLQRYARQMHPNLVATQLESMGLQALQQARGNRLSGGEAQRMALGRLLVVSRKVLLLDEPTAALDLGSLARTERILRHYLATNNCLLILATHQLSLARRLCDEMIFLDQGQVLAKGTLADCLKQAAGQDKAADRLHLFLRFAAAEEQQQDPMEEMM